MDAGLLSVRRFTTPLRFRDPVRPGTVAAPGLAIKSSVIEHVCQEPVGDRS